MLKKIILSAIVLASAVCVFALPAVQSYIGDASGEYVYYQDTTFARPTYVGFLFYNDSQYALRYYAAADAKTKQDEVEVEVLISVNPENEKLEFTGELVVKDGESTLINYMHDLFYDLTARRQKMGEVNGVKDIAKNDFLDVFGGSVVIKYNALIPIFNVKAILNDAGEEQFKVVTVGALKSSQDTSFEDFKGFPKKLADKKRAAVKAGKEKITASAKNADASVTESVQLDNSWHAEFENIWFQGNAAILTLAPLSKPEGDEELLTAMLLRSMLHSGEHSYIDVSNAKIVFDNGFSVTAQYYLNKDSAVQRDIQRLVKTAGGYAFLRLTVFDSLYQKKKSYYENILKSFTAE